MNRHQTDYYFLSILIYFPQRWSINIAECGTLEKLKPGIIINVKPCHKPSTSCRFWWPPGGDRTNQHPSQRRSSSHREHESTTRPLAVGHSTTSTGWHAPWSRCHPAGRDSRCKSCDHGPRARPLNLVSKHLFYHPVSY